MITKEQFEQLVGTELIEEEGKLVYYGNLGLWGRKDITELPDNLMVLGILDLRYTNITKLPKGLIVKTWLDISNTEVEELPEDTMLGGSFYANNMKKPFSFPKVLKVNGIFRCENTIIKCMPEELHVKYDCRFSKSTFDNYPKVMDFSSSLYLGDMPITKLPEGIKKVYGNLNIRNTKVSKLNDNLVVYDRLNLENTLIEDLPKGLIVGNRLNLRETNLKDYSDLHKVCTNFVIDKEKYNEIKDNLFEHSSETLDNEVRVTFKPNHKGAYLFENENGKYIEVNCIFGKIVEQKGNIYHIQRYGDERITYLVIDSEGHWTHENEVFKE